ncbi:MAG: putative endonuclease V [Prokaryotic dsDNA virus sp.]|nr:MAG: putative endonuclease V [Prokaryotic dsDNA virus sp.]|tara:strand:+ start:3623 stop:4003 length:381 start_codon:yes stop_codon:yes gene_type:complete
MTRINCVPPSELTREHLIAEYRELPRVFGMVFGAVERGTTDPAIMDIPPTYRMGTGHMKFFTDKLGYLVKRQKALVAEMRNRGYDPRFPEPEKLLVGIPEAFHGDWEPDEEALRISRARIAERLNG